MQIRYIHVLFCAFVFMVKVANAGPPIPVNAIQRADAVAFDKEVLPILQKNCLACHSASEKQGELVLESPPAILKGGDTGPAVVAGRGAESLLIQMASHQAETVMPPEGNDVAAGNLTPQELGLIKLWIDQGARGTGGIESMSPKQMRSLPKGITAVQAVTLTQDGQYVVFGRGNQILLHHVPTGQLVTELTDPALASSSGGVHRDLVQSLTLNVDGDLLASGGFREVKLWRRPKDVQQLNIATGGPASAMTISPDHKWIAVNGRANTVRLFSTADGAAGPTLTGLTDGVTSLDFVRKPGSSEPTADNLRDCYNVLAGTPDGSVQLWSLSERKLLDAWKGGIVAVRSVASSMDGTMAASGGEDGAMFVWNLNAAPSMPLEGATGEQFAITVLSPTRKHLATVGTKDGQPAIIVRSAETNRITHSLIGHAGSIMSLAFSNDDTRLISGGDDKSIRIWELTNVSQPELRKIEGLTAAVTAVGCNGDGSQILAGFADNALRLLNVADGAVLKEFAGHSGVVSAAGFWNGQPFSVSQDATVRFWNATDGTQVRTFSLLSPPTSFALSADIQRMAFGGADHQVRIHQTDNGGVLQTLQGFATAATSLSFSQDAQLLSVVSADGRVSVFNATTARFREGFTDPRVKAAVFTASTSLLVARANEVISVQSPRFLQHLDGNTQPVRAMAFHPNNPLVFVAAADGSLRGFSPQTGQATFNTGHGAPVNDLAVSTDGQFLATAGDNNLVRVWNTSGAGAGSQQLTGFAGPVHRVAFSADGKQILAVSNGDKPTAQLHDTQTGALLQKFSGHTGVAVGCAMLPVIPNADPNRTLTIALTASPVGVFQWNVTAMKQIPGHGGPVTSLARIPQNPRQVFSGSTDSTIRRWNLDNGQQMQQYNNGGTVAAIAVAPDVQRIASASENHTAKLFNINGQQVAEMRGDIRRRIALCRFAKTL